VKALTKSQIIAFRRKVRNFYRTKGRHDLPWRKTKDAYKILVSEIMLQQTQVSAVIPKYNAFLQRFPTVKELADAPLKEVLTRWQGLGYNRRALNLQKAAQRIVEDHKGRIPEDTESLRTLPGIGSYTAGAVLAFAFNQPVLFIDTNIRRVYIHFFFPKRESVKDEELLPLLEQTVDRKNPRKWYNALMDYGAMLKDTNAHRRSAHYARQSPFVGSHRQLRAAVLRNLLDTPLSAKELRERMGTPLERIESILEELEKEGFISRSKGKFLIR
jgi:A/G-specific adenine glycosylase